MFYSWVFRLFFFYPIFFGVSSCERQCHLLQVDRRRENENHGWASNISYCHCFVTKAHNVRYRRRI